MNLEFEKEIKRRINLIKQKFPHIVLTPIYEDTYSLKRENITEKDIILLTKNDMRIIQKNLVPELMDNSNNLLNKHPIVIPKGITSPKKLESSHYAGTDFNTKEGFYKISSSKVTRCFLSDVINSLVLHYIGTYDLELAEGGVFVLTPYANSHMDLGLNYENITEKLVKTQIGTMNGGLKGKYESQTAYEKRQVRAALAVGLEENGERKQLNGKNVY